MGRKIPDNNTTGYRSTKRSNRFLAGINQEHDNPKEIEKGLLAYNANSPLEKSLVL